MMYLTAEQQKRVEDNHNLLYWFLNKYNLPEDDSYDSAAIGLCLAAATYDDSADCSFSRYAHTCMYNECFRYSYRKTVDTVSLAEPLTSDDDTTFEDVIPDPRDHLTCNTEKLTILSSLSQLSEVQLKVVYLRLLGYSCQQIGTLLDCSAANVHRTLTRARERLARPHVKYNKDRKSPSYTDLLNKTRSIIAIY